MDVGYDLELRIKGGRHVAGRDSLLDIRVLSLDCMVLFYRTCSSSDEDARVM